MIRRSTTVAIALGLVVNLARALRLGAAFEYWTLIAASGIALAFVLDVMAFAAVGTGGRPLNWDLIRKEVGRIAAQHHPTPEP